MRLETGDQKDAAFSLIFGIAPGPQALYRFTLKTYSKGAAQYEHSSFELNSSSTISFPASYAAASYNHFIEVTDLNGIRKRTVQVNIASVLE